MLVELRVAEQRLRAVWEVLDGASVTEVARRFKVSRQSVHAWLRRYAADQARRQSLARRFGRRRHGGADLPSLEDAARPGRRAHC